MGEVLKPQFYVLRPNNVAIPLIAMDELPHNIRIEGVQRVLTMEDVMEMKGVGKAESRHQTYHVLDLNKATAQPAPIQTHDLSFRPPTPSPSASGSDINISASRPAIDKIFPGPKKFYGIEEQKPGSDDETNISNHRVETPSAAEGSSKVLEAFGKHDPLPSWKKLPESGTRLPLPGKKVYCSHWMSTGECDYAQQGCLYKHEMPTDNIELLNALGFQDIPKWYREKHGIGKLTAVPGSGAHIRGPSQSSLMQSNWRSGPGPAVPTRGSRGPPSAPMSRSTSHPIRSHPPRRMNGNAVVRPSSVTHSKALLVNDLLSSAPPSPSIKPTNSLLNSKFAPLAPYSETVPTPTRSGSDADISVSSTLAQTGSPSSTSVDIATPNATSGRVAHVATSKWKSFANNSTLNDSVSEYMTSHSRRSSHVSDYEAELERENKKRDMAEAAEYAEVLARHKSQEEQADLARMQNSAVASAKERLRDSVSDGYEKYSPTAHGHGRKKSGRSKKGSMGGRKVDGAEIAA
ncbi:hypothetical protein PMZ80_010101 [Knufia obscura]|uniref:C3H1-type domain-containing protein n=1 Tax=Knufia obscura TaxID=1635080 RepID=A0ABR0RA35_9EURO|nr:hypothetical protein PMZ80_010101 [Knufia obscura]